MYSQNLEQYYISSYFGNFIGTFLDCGSNDGMFFSNTYALVQKGWSGVLVDASPTAFKKMQVNLGDNPKLQLLNFGVGSEDGDMVFKESGSLVGSGDTALVSSFKDDQVHRWDSLKIPFTEMTAPMKTFKSLMEVSKYKKFDLVSLDIEGCEKEVVPQIDFKELGTRMCVIEFNGIDELFYTNYMNMFGFKMIHKNGENLIFAL